MHDNDPTNDTHPAIAAMIIEGYRKMSPARKLEIVGDLHHMGRELVLSDIRRQYPEADEQEQKMRLATRMYGPEIMRRMFGWDAEKEGY